MLCALRVQNLRVFFLSCPLLFSTLSLTKIVSLSLLQNALLGGTDTASAILECAMAELVRHPSAMSKAQEEVRRTVGEKGKVEEGDIPQLSYLKCVVMETLRLRPVAPLSYRETMDHISIDGYDIPPKTRVIVNTWAIGREAASWEKPEEFIPERFVGSTVDFRGHDFKFIPFGAGRRICPGMNLGITTVELALANLLYAFNWELPDGKESIAMDESTGITVFLEKGLDLKATKSNQS
uniref:Cytochrome P450 71A1 n=1 Tax=Anthurium amnicola TaxID=1678845 RepID=A0A1D1ZB72_9ARAE